MPETQNSWFTRFARAASSLAGKPYTFGAAVAVIVGWGLTGPLFGFSDTWQLVINTGTTIITFMMVFLIQNTQNRDSEAIHIKLDELIRAFENTNNMLLDLEELDEKELLTIRQTYLDLAKAARLQAALKART
ncbi:MAG: low affinity iron permease family protein [Nevskia sp.]|jgi:low affinity Fe/Cu permease|nr:low affinity iron permease family protein [Nevskia sp.]MCK9383395.1 low affinity iron permease family protein [Nevskia sp.]